MVTVPQCRSVTPAHTSAVGVVSVGAGIAAESALTARVRTARQLLHGIAYLVLVMPQAPGFH